VGKNTGVIRRPGYYLCTTEGRKRLHVAMWEHEWGMEVPAGCVIHHLDWCKDHNIISNLVCLTVEEHERVHNIVGGEDGKALGYTLAASRVNGLPARS
jgi:hypothetical protein